MQGSALLAGVGFRVDCGCRVQSRLRAEGSELIAGVGFRVARDLRHQIERPFRGSEKSAACGHTRFSFLRPASSNEGVLLERHLTQSAAWGCSVQSCTRSKATD